MLHTMETSSKAVGTLPSLSERLKVRQTNNVHVSITMSVIKKSITYNTDIHNCMTYVTANYVYWPGPPLLNLI